MVKISDLRQRDVINVIDGRRLGNIKDIELDLELGKVKAIVLPGVNGSLFGFFNRSEDVVVSWEKIKKIGIDVILVELMNFSSSNHE